MNDIAIAAQAVKPWPQYANSRRSVYGAQRRIIKEIKKLEALAEKYEESFDGDALRAQMFKDTQKVLDIVNKARNEDPDGDPTYVYVRGHRERVKREQLG